MAPIFLLKVPLDPLKAACESIGTLRACFLGPQADNWKQNREGHLGAHKIESVPKSPPPLLATIQVIRYI